MATATTERAPSRVERGGVLKRTTQLVGMTLLTATACFLSAGTLHWPRAWVYLCLQVAVTASWVLIVRANPALATARRRIHRDGKRFDKVILRIYVLLLLAVLVVAGLDAVRYHWSVLPFATVYWGVLVNLLTTVPVLWALLVNPLLNPPCASTRNASTCRSPRGPTGLCGTRCAPG